MPPPLPRVARAFAPGRIEIIGNHTDYNHGFVLSCALPQGVEALATRADDGQIRLLFASDPQPAEISIPLSAPLRPTPGAWTNYPLGVFKLLAEAGIPLPPCRITFTSTLPAGAGLSSSAALEVATATALLALAGASIPLMDLARLCRRAENEFAGVNCGLLDQATSVCGRAGHLLLLDFHDETFSLLPFPPDHLFLVIPSGASHTLSGGEYNERRAQCFDAARILGVPFLRDATPAQVEGAASRLPQPALLRARHVTGENARVLECAEALRAGDMTRFGQAMTASHESSRLNFQNSTPELDTLVQIATATPGILGARLTGGGFGGAIVALAQAPAASEAAKHITSEYLRRTGIRTTATPYAPADGARLLPVE